MKNLEEHSKGNKKKTIGRRDYKFFTVKNRLATEWKRENNNGNETEAHRSTLVPTALWRLWYIHYPVPRALLLNNWANKVSIKQSLWTFTNTRTKTSINFWKFQLRRWWIQNLAFTLAPWRIWTILTRDLELSLFTKMP